MDFRRKSEKELERVVAVADGVKAVVRDTFRVQLLARNAIVQARHAGAEARGFGEVSRNMGTMSRELDENMRVLWQMSGAWVRAVSEKLRIDRSARYLERALTDASAHVDVTSVRSRASDRREMTERDVSRARAALTIRFDECDRLATMGCVLARAGKIEASYGSDKRALLSDLSQEFARTADSIYASLKMLRQQVTNWETIP